MQSAATFNHFLITLNKVYTCVYFFEDDGVLSFHPKAPCDVHPWLIMCLNQKHFYQADEKLHIHLWLAGWNKSFIYGSSTANYFFRGPTACWCCWITAVHPGGSYPGQRHRRCGAREAEVRVSRHPCVVQQKHNNIVGNTTSYTFTLFPQTSASRYSHWSSSFAPHCKKYLSIYFI